MPAARTSRPISALLLGLAATLAVAAAHVARLDERMELQALDLRFRRMPAAASAEGIVRISIDDYSLDKLGRWPWPREHLAGVVEVLQACGARAVALDIILPEPQEFRYESATESIYTADRSEVVIDAAPRRVFDDDALAAVLKKHRNVTLPMHLTLAGQRAEVRTDDAIRAAVHRVLSGNPELSLGQVLERLDAPAGARASADAVESAHADSVRRAYLRRHAIRALRRLGISPQAVAGYPAAAGEITPPLVRFAEAIEHTGFVNFQPDVDGVVRHIPLLARSGDVVYPQFALALAAQELAGRGGGRCEITADAAAVTLQCPDGTQRVVPVDDAGRMLINWQPAPAAGAEKTELPVLLPARIWRLKKHLEAMGDFPQIYLLQLAETFGMTDWLEAFTESNEAYRLRAAYTAARQKALLYDPAHVPAPPEGLADAEKRIEARIASNLRRLFEDDLLDSANADEKQLILATRRKIRLVGPAREKLRKVIAAKMAELRPHVAGKICLIGSTATAAPDFVPTPVAGRMAGVSVHADILRTILSGRFIRRSHPATDILVILLAGTAVSLLAATRPVLQAAPLAVLLAAAYAAANIWGLFGAMRVWLALVGPLGAMGGAFLVVTAYRQLTEERAKRHIRGLFAHALSPQLVDRLIDDPSLAHLGGERRELTCFFSDLAGFTPIAERLGEQKTVQLLNRYFDRMTEVIQNRCGGYLNKFLGDGIFAFFGAPVLQDDHPARALRAAVECQEEIRRFNETLADEFDEPVRLACRIGIATGQVMVGNCGSTQRMDYTAIGDTVNLASRLESANKFFGTRILASDSTWAAGGTEAILARPLGPIIVVGKAEPVSVWNLAGSAEAAGETTRRGFADFARGVGLYAEQRFAAAADAFQAARRALGADRACEVYLDLCRTAQAAANGEAFSPAIRLAEK